MRTSLIVGMLGAAALCLTVADAADAGSRRGGREGHGGRGLCGSGPTGIDVEQRDAQQAKDDLCAAGEVSREDARALRTSRHKAFVSILTQDQQEALKSLRQERRSARGPHDRAEDDEPTSEEAIEGASKAAVANTTWAEIKMEAR